MREREVIEDVWTEIDNYNRRFTRDPVEALSRIEEILTRWGEEV